MEPIVKPKGIDDVPVLAVTLWSQDGQSALELERVARSVEAELKRVKGTREVQTIGGPGRRACVVEPARLRERGVSVQQLQQAVASANLGMPSGTVADTSAGSPGMLTGNRRIHALCRRGGRHRGGRQPGPPGVPA